MIKDFSQQESLALTLYEKSKFDQMGHTFSLKFKDKPSYHELFGIRSFNGSLESYVKLVTAAAFTQYFTVKAIKFYNDIKERTQYWKSRNVEDIVKEINKSADKMQKHLKRIAEISDLSFHFDGV